MYWVMLGKVLPRKGQGKPKETTMSIPTIFHRKGYTCRLVKRQGNIVMYSLTNFGRMSYEIMKVQTQKADDPFTNRKAGEEFLPSTSQWGTYGWTYNSLKDAERQFKALTYTQKGELVK